MLKTILDWLNKLLVGALALIGAYDKGRSEGVKDENYKLKKGIEAVMDGDYSSDAAFGRMRRETGADLDPPHTGADQGDV